MPVFIGNDMPEMSLNFNLDLVKSVGEKHRRSRERITAGTIEAIQPNLCCLSV